ncbi:MAG: hypothetical protein ABR575_07665 [Actinomycetota bacterium]
MRKLVGVLVVGALALPMAPASSAAARDDQENVIFAAGGTPVSNGVFFPGTRLCLDSQCYGEPLQMERGSDLRFVNLDSGVVANAHQIKSFRVNKRTGRALFISRLIAGPGEDLVITSHLKPGRYPFYCTTHAGMNGALRVIKP